MHGRDEATVLAAELVEMVLPIDDRPPSVEADSLEAGRRSPPEADLDDDGTAAGIGLCILCETCLRNDDGGSDGLVERRRSGDESDPPLSADRRCRCAIGVFSSMISTQPSTPGRSGVSFVFSFSLVLVFSTFPTSFDIESLEPPRPEMLPIRSLGTREWIFCSSALTRVRISLTICTPLLLDTDGTAALKLLTRGTAVVVCIRGGRVIGSRDGEGDIVVGMVTERGIAPGVPGLKPARLYTGLWPTDGADSGTETVADDGLVPIGDSSSKVAG